MSGSLAARPTPPEPDGLDDGSAAAVLDAAEDIINSIGPEVLADLTPEPEPDRWYRRLFKRRRRQ